MFVVETEVLPDDFEAIRWPVTPGNTWLSMPDLEMPFEMAVLWAQDWVKHNPREGRARVCLAQDYDTVVATFGRRLTERRMRMNWAGL
jgi:hypothetical protein